MENVAKAQENDWTPKIQSRDDRWRQRGILICTGGALKNFTLVIKINVKKIPRNTLDKRPNVIPIKTAWKLFSSSSGRINVKEQPEQNLTKNNVML